MAKPTHGEIMERLLELKTLERSLRTQLDGLCKRRASFLAANIDPPNELNDRVRAINRQLIDVVGVVTPLQNKVGDSIDRRRKNRFYLSIKN